MVDNMGKEKGLFTLYTTHQNEVQDWNLNA